MSAMSSVHWEFRRRLAQIPPHRLGLSVDLYSPDLSSLLRALQKRQVLPHYFEIFRAAPTALAAAKQEVANCPLTYHGEGLWLTEPEAAEDPGFRREIVEVAAHLQSLESAWLNHECATKYIAGYSFGTYLPPLYTKSSAAVVAENTIFIQDLLDRHGRLSNGYTPLVLLEMAPLTYFAAGTLSIPTFFRMVTERAPCGLVLDVGHLWTVFRYGGASQSLPLSQFIKSFLNEFPLERVVQIHVAGLANHESLLNCGFEARDREWDDGLPTWTDAHAASIPAVLFEILDEILRHPRLTALKGLALEVDTKSEDLIVDEFAHFSQRYATVFSKVIPEASVVVDLEHESRHSEPVSASTKRVLNRSYDRYARIVAGLTEPEGEEWMFFPESRKGLAFYQTTYLPYEILSWGGDLEAMFPESCSQLLDGGVSLQGFIPFWFRRPRPLAESYDFFLMKIDRFLEFVHESAPDVFEIAKREAEGLIRDYRLANEPPVQAAKEGA